MAKKIRIDGTPHHDDLPNITLDRIQKKDRTFMESLGIKDTDQAFEMLEMMGFDIPKLKQAIINDEQFPNSEKEMMERFYNPENDLIRKMMEKMKNDDEDDEDGDEDEWMEEEDFGTISKLMHDVKPQEYLLRISLKDSPVPVWREVKVPSNLSLEALAVILVHAMGWNNSHMHQLRFKNNYYLSSEEDINDFGYDGPRFINHNANDFHVGQLFNEKGVKIELEYDFGDSWKHNVWMKSVRDYEPDEKPTVELVKGKGVCPPDDCGGVWGYEELLLLNKKKRKTSEEKERLKWHFIDKDYDPDYFDFEEESWYLNDVWEAMQEYFENKGKE